MKPGNIMLQAPGEDEEQAKLIDFGIANVGDSQISTSIPSLGIAGTLGYLAPEQFEGAPPSIASDVYAMAVVAYEMVTGRHPFNAESNAHLIKLQSEGVKIRPGDLRPGLPGAAGECILKALSVRPEDRFRKARDFGEALALALPGDPGQPRVRAQVETESDRTLDAHFLFLDLVGHSRLLNRDQKSNIELLQRLVRETPEFREANAGHRLLRLPAGDGMALVFFGDAVPAVACAISIAVAIENHAHLKVRIGLNTGQVYRVTDINTASNVVGDGINMAQRVMDCGDAGQILLSKSIAEAHPAHGLGPSLAGPRRTGSEAWRKDPSFQPPPGRPQCPRERANRRRPAAAGEPDACWSPFDSDNDWRCCSGSCRGCGRVALLRTRGSISDARESHAC